MKKFTVNWEIPNSDEFESDCKDKWILAEEIDEQLLAHEYVYTKTDDVYIEIFCNDCNEQIAQGYWASFQFPLKCECKKLS